MRIKTYQSLIEIKIGYNLDTIAVTGWVYVQIKKGYCILQVGKLAGGKLSTHLTQYGYCPRQHTPGPWKYDT